jgi:hypothetical protein
MTLYISDIWFVVDCVSDWVCVCVCVCVHFVALLPDPRKHAVCVSGSCVLETARSREQRCALAVSKWVKEQWRKVWLVFSKSDLIGNSKKYSFHSLFKIVCAIHVSNKFITFLCTCYSRTFSVHPVERLLATVTGGFKAIRHKLHFTGGSKPSIINCSVDLHPRKG